MTPLASLPDRMSVSGRKPSPGPVALRRRPGTESTRVGAAAATRELSPMNSPVSAWVCPRQVLLFSVRND